MKWFIAFTINFLLLTGSVQTQHMAKMKVIYVYDALCGWCYGFSPVIEEFARTHANELDIEVVSGGMVTGERIGPIGEVAAYISWAYKDVEKATGVTFGKHFLEGILRDGKAVFTSIPPAIALSVFKSLKPEQSLAFAARLQKAVYYDGIEPEKLAAYGTLAKEFGIDADDFIAKMQQEDYANAAEEDFSKSAALQVSGFPTIFLEHKGKLVLFGRGYTSIQNLEYQFSQAKKMIQP
jgi:putative protein-disulfide isomerase